jgi:tetratricopeptide (TPR) repeat protein
VAIRPQPVPRRAIRIGIALLGGVFLALSLGTAWLLGTAQQLSQSAARHAAAPWCGPEVVNNCRATQAATVVERRVVSNRYDSYRQVTVRFAAGPPIDLRQTSGNLYAVAGPGRAVTAEFWEGAPVALEDAAGHRMTTDHDPEWASANNVHYALFVAFFTALALAALVTAIQGPRHPSPVWDSPRARAYVHDRQNDVSPTRFALLGLFGLDLLLVCLAPAESYWAPGRHFPDPIGLPQGLVVFVVLAGLVIWDVVRFVRHRGTVPRTAAAYYARAKSRIAAADYAGAVADLTAVLRRDPRHAGAYRLRGDLYRRAGDRDRALQDYNQAVALGDHAATVYHARAEVQLRCGAAAAAVADYTQALRGADDTATTATLYPGRSAAQTATGARAAAERDYAAAYALDPQGTGSYEMRAQLYADGRQPAPLPPAVRAAITDAPGRALTYYTAALRVNPAATGAYVERAIAHAARGARRAAQRDLRAALRGDPAGHTAYLERARLVLDAGTTPRPAWQDLNQALALVPQDSEAYRLRAAYWVQEALRAERKKGGATRRAAQDHALSDLNTAIRADPREVGLYQDRAAVHLLREEPDQARRDLDTAIELAPTEPENYCLRARFYAGQGDRRHARAEYTQALALITDPAWRTQVQEEREALGEY